MSIYKIITQRHIYVIACCAAALAMLLIIPAVSVRGETAVRDRYISASASGKKLPIYSVGRTEEPECVSLSFDAAWGNEDTQTLIDILGANDIHATFFCVEGWVEKYPESVKALSDAGHEIMNHSTTHPHMSQLSKQQIREEIENCNDKIEAITGKRPTLFRAPYGEYTNELIEVLDELGMKCIQWDVDSLDWKELPANQIISRVCSKAKNGSIVLFHNAALHTPEALPGIIADLKAKGYIFKPISESIYWDNYHIDVNGCQQKDTAAESGSDKNNM